MLLHDDKFKEIHMYCQAIRKRLETANSPPPRKEKKKTEKKTGKLMMRGKNGKSKVKVKKVIPFLGNNILLTKEGYHRAGVHETLLDAQRSVISSLFETNLRLNRTTLHIDLWMEDYVHSCLSLREVNTFKMEYLDGCRYDIDKGVAVAILVDSIGNTVDYLSMYDWISGGFLFPEVLIHGYEGEEKRGWYFLYDRIVRQRSK
jgi:hypothetical protein